MLPNRIYIKPNWYTRQAALPTGYSLYQYGDDFQCLGSARSCASGGCPAVMVLPDERTAAPDTIFTEQWQYYVYAINMGMNESAIIALMGDAKALFNNTGFGNPDKPVNNYISGKTGYAKDPRLDKLRTFALNTHALKRSGDKLLLLTMDGTKNPPLKPGRSYPRSKAEINPDDYLYLPETHRYLFLDCTNVRWKPSTSGQFLAYGPFANGLVRPWIGDGKIHSFMPLVSTRLNYCPTNEWNLVTGEFPSPFRQ